MLPIQGRADNTNSETRDIRELSQHFTDPEDHSPWIFLPQDNIESLSTAERPGYATIWESGKGKDIKGILKDPIKIDDYPLPWEFHLGFVQLKGSEMPMQFNYAIGFNIALTFSDPSTWPKDRSEQPPDTHSVQLFDVHLKIPQMKPSSLNYGLGSSEVYMIYGRGDLAPNALGNWRIPYALTLNGREADGGPASFAFSFRAKLISETALEIGFFGGLTGNPHPGWTSRTIDVSRFGKITGIWEIGPIISLDRWMPDVLGPELEIDPSPPIELPNPSNQYYVVDYAVFNDGRLPWSDDFDIPGYNPRWHCEGTAICETYSHPGHLTVTVPLEVGWAMCPRAIGSQVDLSEIEDFPGYEIEIGFFPPEESASWDLYFSSVNLWDEDGKPVGGNIMPFQDPGAWQVGLVKYPGGSKPRFVNIFSSTPDANKNPVINVEFEPEIPESILTHRPLYMLIQILDSSHLRVGFKSSKSDPWYLSKAFDTTTTFGKIGKFGAFPCVTISAPDINERSWGVGNFPRYPQYLIDYVH